MKYKGFTVEKDGSCICFYGTHEGYLLTRYYWYYSMRQAKKLFTEYLKTKSI